MATSADCKSVASRGDGVRLPGYPPKCESGGMVYTADLKSAALRLAGSSPASRTKFGLKVFMDAREPVTLEEGDRYPLGPPNL